MYLKFPGSPFMVIAKSRAPLLNVKQPSLQTCARLKSSLTEARYATAPSLPQLTARAPTCLHTPDHNYTMSILWPGTAPWLITRSGESSSHACTKIIRYIGARHLAVLPPHRFTFPLHQQKATYKLSFHEQNGSNGGNALYKRNTLENQSLECLSASYKQSVWCNQKALNQQTSNQDTSSQDTSGQNTLPEEHDLISGSQNPYQQFQRVKRQCAVAFFCDHQNDEQEKLVQRRTTNLGAMVDLLKEHVPMLLQVSLPKAIVLEDVLLRICPSHFELINAYLPNIRGHVSYYATFKAAQLFLTSLMLNPNTHLHIELMRTSKIPDRNCFSAHSTKIYVRWSTCSEGCHHLVQDPLMLELQSSTSNAKLGSHRWSRIDAGEFSHKLDWSITNSISDLGKGIIGLTKHDSRLERKILGVFIFELNEENDQITVHTVEDMNIIERHEELNVGNKLRVC